MTQRRKARNVREWEGVVGERNELDEVRAFVMWGVGAPPERAAVPEEAERPGKPASQVAMRIGRVPRP